jgi:hypothetical protein
MDFGLINFSKLVTDDQAACMAAVVSQQLNQQVVPTWGVEPSSVAFYGNNPLKLPVGVSPVILMDNEDDPGALGYHSIDTIHIFCGMVFGSGGQALWYAPPDVTDSQGNIVTIGTPLTVSSVLSHELCETLVDPLCNEWRHNPDKDLMYALEICDPVERLDYVMHGLHADGSDTLVYVSDFVTPAWYDATLTGPKDWLGLCQDAFSVAGGGYCQVMKPDGSTSTLFGLGFDKFGPAGQRIQSPFSRYKKRLNHD